MSAAMLAAEPGLSERIETSTAIHYNPGQSRKETSIFPTTAGSLWLQMELKSYDFVMPFGITWSILH